MTILNWSFPRKDISRRAQAFQLALALRDEVADLEKAGCRVIQARARLPATVQIGAREASAQQWAPFLPPPSQGSSSLQRHAAADACAGPRAEGERLHTQACYPSLKEQEQESRVSSGRGGRWTSRRCARACR